MTKNISSRAAWPLLGASLLLGACVTDGVFTPDQPVAEPAPVVDTAFLEQERARAEETALMDAAILAFGACKEDAMMLDTQGRATGDAAKYLASARLLETCEAELPPELHGQMVDGRMRVLALSVQNNVKGGDIAAARAGLSRFASAFPGQDLYYGDGSSFLDSFSVLLDGRMGSGELALANARPEVKSEMRRLRFWQRN